MPMRYAALGTDAAEHLPVTLVFAAVYFYVVLPPISLKS